MCKPRTGPLSIDLSNCICEMADLVEDDATKVSVVCGDLYERDEKGNAIHREPPRRDIKPSKRYIAEEWALLR